VTLLKDKIKIKIANRLLFFVEWLLLTNQLNQQINQIRQILEQIKTSAFHESMIT